MASNNNEIKTKVKSLYEIMKDEKIQELEVDSEEYSIFIKRKGSVLSQTVPLQQQPVASAEVPASAEEKAKPEMPAETIKSPITGVFYRAPSPSSPVYASEGDIIETGKTLCIVEAMKVMNEIKATFKVKIIKVLAENGKPVNAGQDLFEVEKA